MIAVDTNILVYAHRADAPWHDLARARLVELAESGERWGIPWPCVHEFLAVVTHPKIYRPPTPTPTAVEAIKAWAASPGLSFLTEGPDHLLVLSRLLSAAQIAGGQVHDARIAAICIQSGVKRLWSVDRDFSRYPTLRTINPLR